MLKTADLCHGKVSTITLDGASVTNAVWDAAAGTLTAAIPVCGLKPRVLVCE